MSGAKTFPLQPTPELLKMLVKLAQSKDFERLMQHLDGRCTAIAIQAHKVAEEPYKTWASGRVQELGELLYLYHQRAALLKMMPSTGPGGFTPGGDE